MRDRKKLGWTFWITASVLVVAYPLSWGPVAWLADRGMLSEPVFDFAVAYLSPLQWLVDRSTPLLPLAAHLSRIIHERAKC